MLLSTVPLGLKKEEPRAGKRKPIEETVEEDDLKKVSSSIDCLYQTLKERL
jgi:hypothetical protein